MNIGSHPSLPCLAHLHHTWQVGGQSGPGWWKGKNNGGRSARSCLAQALTWLVWVWGSSGFVSLSLCFPLHMWGGKHKYGVLFCFTQLFSIWLWIGSPWSSMNLSVLSENNVWWREGGAWEAQMAPSCFLSADFVSHCLVPLTQQCKWQVCRWSLLQRRKKEKSKKIYNFW